jgi:hypothetical protein
VLQPIFYMRVFEDLPSPHFTTALQVLGITAAVLAAAGLAFTAALSISLACGLVLDGMLNSVGRIIVGDAALVLCLLVLLAGGGASAETWTLREPARRLLAWARGRDAPERASRRPGAFPSTRYGWPLRTAMITTALAYFLAGVQKVRYSGLAWVTGSNLRWVLYASSDRQSTPNRLALFVAGRPIAAHLVAAGALGLELCFPLVLFLPKVRWVILPAVVVMHVTIHSAMGLDYSAQWLTVLTLFVEWPAVVTRLAVEHRRRWPPFQPQSGWRSTRLPAR